MISKTLRIARMIVLASFALSSAAWAATCSNASLSGTYGLWARARTPRVSLRPTSSSSNLTHPQASLRERMKPGLLLVEHMQSLRTARSRVRPRKAEALPFLCCGHFRRVAIS